MKSRTLKLEGRLSNSNKYIFEYPFGSLENITSGRWEVAISAITAVFSKTLPWNAIFEVSCNYVEAVVIKDSQRVREQMPLGFVRLKGKPGEHLLLGYKWRDFFEVTTPSKTLSFTLREVIDPEIPTPPIPAGRERAAWLSILLIFRRME